MALDTSSASDRAVGSKDLDAAHQLFPSVWQRVMPKEQVCPVIIPTRAPETPSAPTQERTQQVPALRTEQERTQQLPALRTEEEHAECGAAFAAREAVPFFGSGSADFSALLQEMLLRERYSAKLCRSLARRATGMAARTLSQLCAEHQRAMRRLAAAHFLITGVQPSIDAAGLVELGSYLHSLREQFIELQQLSALYAAAAVEARDPWLRRLFHTLSEERLAQAARICALVEQS